LQLNIMLNNVRYRRFAGVMLPAVWRKQ